MSILLLFVLGLCIGSFLNVLIDRLARNENMQGRSYCESCKKTLKPLDLIPIISFVYLRGRCRYCHTSLSYQYPFVELLTGMLFVLTYGIMNHELGIMGYINLSYYLFIVSSLIVIFFSDLKYGIIPDKILIALILIISPYLFMIHNSLFLIHFVSAIGAFLFFFVIYLITKGKGMGLGDVKFSFLLGLVLGVGGTVIALYIAFLTGGILGFILILWKKKTLTQAIPFGPFLVIGGIISLFFEPQISRIINQII